MRQIPLFLLLTACGPSPVAVCAGNHSGTFDGSDIGTMTGTLDEKGKAKITLVGEASGELSNSGSVDNDGTMTLSGLVAVEGVLDLETCASSGTWDQSLAGLSGTWEMSLD